MARLKVLAPRVARLAPRLVAPVVERIGGRRLQAINREHKWKHPLCVECERNGRTTLATEVDHVQPLARGGRESLDPFANRQALCHACHVAKSQRERIAREGRAT